MIYLGTITKNGKKVEVYETGRKGIDSPATWYYKYNGKLISPVERRIRKWEAPNFTDLLKLSYGNSIIVDCAYDTNPFLKHIPKDHTFKGGNLIIPLKGY